MSDVSEGRMPFPWYIPPSSKIKTSLPLSPVCSETGKNRDVGVSNKDRETMYLALPGRKWKPGVSRQRRPRPPSISCRSKGSARWESSTKDNSREVSQPARNKDLLSGDQYDRWLRNWGPPKEKVGALVVRRAPNK